MKKNERKIVLASAEFIETSLGTILSEAGYTLTSDFIEGDLNFYHFIVDDFMPEIINLPRLITKEKSQFDFNDRAFIKVENLEGSASKLLTNYFVARESLDLTDSYSRLQKDVFTIKIQDYLNIGYFIDLMVVEAYKGNFDIATIRNFLNHSIEYFIKLSEAKGNLLPLEVTFSHDENIFAVSINSNVKSFKFDLDFVNNEEFQNNFVQNSNFVDLTYLEKKGRLVLSSAWMKDAGKFHAFFFTEVVRRKQEETSFSKLMLAKENTDIKYKPDLKEQKANVSELGLIVKIVKFAKNEFSEELENGYELNLEDLQESLANYPEQDELVNINDEVLIKVLSVLKNTEDNESVTVVKGGAEEKEAVSIIKGTSEENEKEKITVIKGTSESTDNSIQEIKTIDNSLELKALEFERKCKDLEIKYAKSSDQNIRLRKILDQLKIEFVKLKAIAEASKNIEKEKVIDPMAILQEEHKTTSSDEMLALKIKEKSLLRAKSDLEQVVLSKDLTIAQLEMKIENFKKEFIKTKEFGNQEKVFKLEAENKNLLSKIDIMNQGIKNIAENSSIKESEQIAKKEKENESLKTQMQLAQDLIKQFKIEKEESASLAQIEIEQLKKTIASHEKNALIIEQMKNPEAFDISTTTTEEKVLTEKLTIITSEKKALDDRFKEQGLELKKLEHKLKIATVQLDEANKKKSKNEKSGSNSNETYIKQLEAASRKLTEATFELSEKKKEALRFKLENTQLTTRIQELEKKLLTSDKKAS